MTTRRLAGRRILVVGAASGIGRATAELFAEEGAALALLDVDARGLGTVSEALAAASEALDLADFERVEGAVMRANAALGGLDGVVNAAGIADTSALDAARIVDWTRVVAVNLIGPAMVCRAALPALRAARGTIVNLASGAGLLPAAPNNTAYASSKGGLIAFGKALALEAAPAVRVNTVCPGLTRTPLTESLFAGHEDDPASAPAVAGYALGRPAEPEEIARACLYLTSEESSFVTGSTLVVDGGRIFH